MDGVHSQINIHFLSILLILAVFSDPSFCVLENAVHLVYLKKGGLIFVCIHTNIVLMDHLQRNLYGFIAKW